MVLSILFWQQLTFKLIVTIYVWFLRVWCLYHVLQSDEMKQEIQRNCSSHTSSDFKLRVTVNAQDIFKKTDTTNPNGKLTPTASPLHLGDIT